MKGNISKELIPLNDVVEAVGKKYGTTKDSLARVAMRVLKPNGTFMWSLETYKKIQRTV